MVHKRSLLIVFFKDSTAAREMQSPPGGCFFDENFKKVIKTYSFFGRGVL
jgi:hypothetical protein